MQKSASFIITVLCGLLFSISAYSQTEIKSFTNDLSPALNGQEVIFSCPLVVTKTYYSTPSGDIILSPERLYNPTEIVSPGTEANNLAATYAQLTLTLKSSNYTYTDDNHTLRTGSVVTGLRGTLSYSNNKYYLVPTVKPVFAGNKRTTVPGSVGTCNLKVASFNIEYYIASPTQWGTGYGAANQQQFDRQHSKVLAALKGLDADVYALCEVGEGSASVNDLVNGLNALTSSNNYAYVEDNNTTESTYTKNVFIYNKTKVTPYRTIYPVGSGGYRLRQVAQAFDLKSNGERVIITVNHLKSKSGSGTGKDADQGDGQGTYNDKRITQAQDLVNSLNTLTTYYSDPDVLVVGDMNSYSMEDPIKVYTTNGLINQLQRYSPSDYSYVYSGNVGYLDHSLATTSLSQQITGARPWHINADEPSYFEYAYSTYYSADPYRCSDHDPIVTGLNLGTYSTGISGTLSEDDDQLHVYGESSKGYITLSASRIDRVDLITMGGQLVYSSSNKIPGEYFLLSTASLQKGFYIVRAYNGKKTMVTKLLVS